MAKEEIKVIESNAQGKLYQARLAEIVSPLFKTKKEAEKWLAKLKEKIDPN